MDDPNSDFKLIFCSAYCLVGMAFMGTCVSMMFDGIKRKVCELTVTIKKLWSAFTCRKPTLEDQKKEQLEMLARVKQLKFYFDDEPHEEQNHVPEAS